MVLDAGKKYFITFATPQQKTFAFWHARPKLLRKITIVNIITWLLFQWNGCAVF